MSNKLIFSDTHFPYHHKDMFDFLLSVKEAFNTTETICLGDIIDNYNLSNFDKDPDAESFTEEYIRVERAIEELYDLFPKLIITLGNHEIRYIRKLSRAGIPKRFTKDLAAVLNLPTGWTTVDKLEKDGILFEHGSRSGKYATLNSALDNHMNTCIGHTHSFAGVHYASSPTGKTLWGLNTGCLIDVEAVAFSYAKDLRNKPVLGCGVIVDNIPIFVPMFVDKNNNWVGEV